MKTSSPKTRPTGAVPEATLWRTDVAWPQDQEPLLALLDEADVPQLLARLKKVGANVSGSGKTTLETALAQPDLLARLTDPKRGAGSLALALVAQHPAGMDRDHLLFELTLLLDDDARTATAGVAALSELGVVLMVGGKRGDRFRVLAPLRPGLAQLTGPWLDALERRGGSPGSGERLGIRIKTSPLHALALLTAHLASVPPRLRGSTLGAELHAKDGAKVLEALHHVMDRTLIPALVSLAVKAGLARPNGTRLTASLDGLDVLRQPAETFWRTLLPQAFALRGFAAIMRMLREPEPGFVPESTLRRALKALHHTEQLIGGHSFPTDGRGNEAAARAELDALRVSPLLEPGRTPEGHPALRIHPDIVKALRPAPTPAPESHRADGHVGADHEVHVGPSTPPHLLAALGFFAEARILDTVSRFNITQAQVANAAARGLEPHQMQAVLTALSPRPIPDNVVRTLGDYGATHGRAVFGRGLVVVFGGTADAERALGDAVLGRLLGDPLAPGVYLVDTAREAEARSRLKELGLAVGEDTLMYSTAAAADADEEGQGPDAPLASRIQSARRAGVDQALQDAAAQVPVAGRPVPAQLLAQLSGIPAAALAPPPPGGDVVPLRAKKSAQPSAGATGGGRTALLEQARLAGRAVRLRYEPEAGGGSETMTVEILESFERAGNAMVRVRFPGNPRAAERVLRVSRVQSVEAAPRAEPG